MIINGRANTQSSCLAILKNLQMTALAGLELHLNDCGGLTVSMLKKPDIDPQAKDVVRIRSIGAISCRGAIARTLREQAVRRVENSWALAEILSLVGVPESQQPMYGKALKAGSVVLILQGDTKPLRCSRRVLKTTSLVKPVLYLA